MDVASTSLTVMEFRRHMGATIDRAFFDGPLTITRNGRAVAVLVPANEYEKLLAGTHPLQKETERAE